MDYAAILLHLFPGARWMLDGDGYDGLHWDASNVDPKPSQQTLAAAWPEVRDARAWRAVRAQRDRLLTACDWTQIADAPVDAAAWAGYRQALRDIPQDFASPDAVVWPEQP